LIAPISDNYARTRAKFKEHLTNQAYSPVTFWMSGLPNKSGWKACIIKAAALERGQICGGVLCSAGEGA
jgi:hypothetical protein